MVPVPTYKAADFDKMIADVHPDKVIVTSMDRTHHQYICRAMELGCDVITEKPMTIDAELSLRDYPSPWHRSFLLLVHFHLVLL